MIIAILACYNRRTLTEQALAGLVAAAAKAAVGLRVVLFDDGSTDGTAEAAAEVLPAGSLQVITGSGAAFWARGMATAEAHALQTAADDDLLLWLNDDVTLREDSLVSLLGVLAGRTDRIAVGATTDPEDGRLNYGGYVRSGSHPLRFRHLDPGGGPHRVDTLNGNAVLVPIAAARRIGGIEGTFSHGLADIDYGIRANRAGVVPLLAPQPVGTCPSHPPVPIRPIAEEWAAFRSIKGGGHPASMRRILSRVRPRTWPFFFLWSYTTWWLRTLRRHLGRVRPLSGRG